MLGCGGRLRSWVREAGKKGLCLYILVHEFPQRGVVVNHTGGRLVTLPAVGSGPHLHFTFNFDRVLIFA